MEAHPTENPRTGREQIADINSSFKLAIKIIIARKRRSPEGPELFKAISNLALASKTLNNLFDDEIVISSCRCIKGGGCRFARNKLYGYIRTSNIERFIKCADQITQSYHPSVYIHIFTKCLLDIVKQCSYEFLASYFNYLTARGIILPQNPSMPHQKQEAIQINGKYLQFKPMQVVKALQISNENGWTDKALLLFDHLLKYYTSGFGRNAKEEEIRKSIIAIISKNNKLNFDGQLGNQITQLLSTGWFEEHRFNTLLGPKKLELSKVPQEVFDLPIEQQPWFWGLTDEDKFKELDCSADGAFFVTFHGSKLIVKKRKNKQRELFTAEYLQRADIKFYLSNGGKAPAYISLYHFYCCLVKQDLDALKSFESLIRITDWEWELLPNPFVELVANVHSPRDEIVQYLIDCNVPIELSPWPEKSPVHDDNIATVQKLLSLDATIDTELIIQLLQKSAFINVTQMQILLDAWRCDPKSATRLLSFALIDYREQYERHREQICTILWIHKHGKSDTCNYLQTLPKELIRAIIDYLGKKPLFHELAVMIMSIQWLRFNNDFPTLEDLERSPKVGQLIMEGKNIEMKNIAINRFNNASYKVIRKNYYWIREAFCNHEQNSLLIRTKDRKLINFMLKYETNASIFRHFHRHYRTYLNLDFTEAFKTKNMTALEFYTKERNMFTMPSQEVFEAKLKKPKYNMTYEEALELIENITAIN